MILRAQLATDFKIPLRWNYDRDYASLWQFLLVTLMSNVICNLSFKVIFRTLGGWVRKFCFCARKRRLWKWFILLHKILSFLLSQWDFVNEEWLYSVTACKQEYLVKYRDLIIQETSLDLSEEVVDDLRRLEQNPQTSLTIFSQ